MPTAETRLTTDRASRYLVQLCRHLRQMPRIGHRPPGGGHGEGRTPPEVGHVEFTDTHGTVRFADGLWTLNATTDALTLRVDADDEEALRRLQDGIAARIEKIGRRDGLRVHWRPAAAGEPPQAGADTQGRTHEAGRRHGPRGTALAMAAGGALIIAVHLGIGGAALAGAKWTDWAVTAVLVLVLAKLVLLGGHLLRGRAASHRGLVSRQRRRHHGRGGADVTG
ncbi:DUF2218 domain-containing protein [Streptomyces sp. NPDC059618]|uniref:DUF2218 domain-containing protein n=1 Tax=Streptomyces sp. NPDC059618 TaxID=3346887 RepID=UPI003675E167